MFLKFIKSHGYIEMFFFVILTTFFSGVTRTMWCIYFKVFLFVWPFHPIWRPETKHLVHANRKYAIKSIKKVYESVGKLLLLTKSAPVYLAQTKVFCVAFFLVWCTLFGSYLNRRRTLSLHSFVFNQSNFFIRVFSLSLSRWFKLQALHSRLSSLLDCIEKTEASEILS